MSTHTTNTNVQKNKRFLKWFLIGVAIVIALIIIAALSIDSEQSAAGDIAEQTSETATAEISGDRLNIEAEARDLEHAAVITTDALYAYSLNSDDLEDINIVTVTTTSNGATIATPQYGATTIHNIDFGTITPQEVWDHAQAGNTP